MVTLVLWRVQTVSYDEVTAELKEHEEIYLNLLSDLGRNALITSEYGEFQNYASNLKNIVSIESIFMTDFRNVIVVSSEYKFLSNVLPELKDDESGHWKSRRIALQSGDIGNIHIKFSNNRIRTAYRKAIIQGIVIAGISMAVIAFAGLMIGYLLVRRLEKLNDLAGKMSKGNLDIRADISGSDEIAQLGNTLNHMTQKIKSSIDSLNQREDQILRSLREKEVMLKEIHHRVKNNMQVIISLLNLQAKGIADETVRVKFEDSRNRVYSMSLIHEKLYRSADLAHIDFKEYLKSLVDGIADTYKRHDVVFSMDMEPVALDVNVGIPCGLIVNELVSNSLKYAFPEGRKGTIKGGLNRKREGNNVLFIDDNGIGFPENLDFRNTSSLGLQLVNVLTGQIHGTIELSKVGSTRFTITFPGTLNYTCEQNG